MGCNNPLSQSARISPYDANTKELDPPCVSALTLRRPRCDKTGEAAKPPRGDWFVRWVGMICLANISTITLYIYIYQHLVHRCDVFMCMCNFVYIYIMYVAIYIYIDDIRLNFVLTCMKLCYIGLYCIALYYIISYIFL